MNICFFVKYQINWGSSRERIGVYLDYLKERGHTYKVIHCIPERLSRISIGKKNKYSLFRLVSFLWYWRILKHLKLIWIIIIARRFDVILVQKISLMYPLLSLLSFRNRNIVFDFDDQCFCDLDSARADKLPLAKKFGIWYKGIQHPAVLRLYKKVIAGNAYLADLAAIVKDRSDVSIIPTSIDCNLYHPGQRITQSRPVVIGWSGSGENHLRHLELLVNPLKEIKKECDFTFKLIGAMNSRKIRELFAFLDSRFICIDWCSDYRGLAQTVRSFDIGVMPLRDDDESRGKCGFKVLQYMASGVPAVISPVGVNKDIVKDGKNGFLAASAEEWAERLIRLIKNQDLRQAFSKEGRETAEGVYSRENVFPKWLDVLSAVGNRGVGF